LAEQEPKIQDLKSETKRLRRELEEAREEGKKGQSVLLEEQNHLKVTVERLTHEKEEFREKSFDLSEEVRTLKEILCKKDEEERRLQQLVESSRTEEDKLRGELEEVKEQLQLATKVGMETEVVKSELGRLEREGDSLKSEIEQLQDIVKAKNARLEEMDSTILELRGNEELYQQEIQSLKKKQSIVYKSRQATPNTSNYNSRPTTTKANNQAKPSVSREKNKSRATAASQERSPEKLSKIIKQQDNNQKKFLEDISKYGLGSQEKSPIPTRSRQ